MRRRSTDNIVLCFLEMQFHWELRWFKSDYNLFAVINLYKDRHSYDGYTIFSKWKTCVQIQTRYIFHAPNEQLKICTPLLKDDLEGSSKRSSIVSFSKFVVNESGLCTFHANWVPRITGILFPTNRYLWYIHTLLYFITKVFLIREIALHRPVTRKRSAWSVS